MSAGFQIALVAAGSAGLMLVLIVIVGRWVSAVNSARATGSRLGVQETVVPVVGSGGRASEPDLAEVLNDAGL